MENETNKQETVAEENTTPAEQVEQTEKEETKENSDVQKQVDEAVKKTKRELSKTLGINVFDDKEVETYLESQKNKVDKAEYDKLQKELEGVNDLKSERDQYAMENAIIKHNVQDDYRDKVEKLVKVEMADNNELTYDKAVEQVVADMPFFTRKAKKAGVDINDNSASKTGNEAFMARNYYKDPKTGQWRKK